MALMFSRLAHNFIKNGYFPTDAVTLERILSAIEPDGESLRIHDPCCGEGTALAEVKRHLATDATVQALGIEYDAERAWHAKQLLDVAIHSDVHDVWLTPRSCGLLFLNPPYGNVIADKGSTAGDSSKGGRLEKVFIKRTMGCLQYGGVLVLIVPHYVVDADLASLLARNFDRLSFYMAPETRFKQCVIFGVRRRVRHPPTAVVEELTQAGQAGPGLSPDRELPELWTQERYRIPAVVSDADFRFSAVRIDAQQLAAEVQRFRANTLWPQFQTVFGQVAKDHRPPLRELSRWHLALALAAGQITGSVTSEAGRKLFIKGDTFKEKSRSVELTIDEKGNYSETVVMTDKFVPIIRGIDMTAGPTLGDIVTIR